MNIELLYFEGCPGWEEAQKNLRVALQEEKLEAEIIPVRVEDNNEAERLKFLGSPSFRVDGIELWPEQRRRYNLSCRVYATPQGLKAAPSVEMFREKLRNRSR